MKVYVITKGIYSDYHICCVTDTMEKAEKLRKIFTDYDGAAIEEYTLDESNDIMAGFDVWRIERTTTGTLNVECLGDDYDRNALNRVFDLQFRKGYICVNVLARDEEHAKKKALDLFMKYDAEKEGII